MGYIENYNIWLKSDYIDIKTKEELHSISENKQEIEDRFYKDLEFGTGGIRGVLGAGSNRMNIYTIRKATQGLANFILKQPGDVAGKSVVIAHDPRRMSAEFAQEAALVLNGNGIKSYVFDELRPTPLLSFAVRHLGCIAGIVITASHNPKEYNGYKVYWSDGAQVTFPHDEDIIKEVNKITDFAQIKLANKEDSIKNGLFSVCQPSLDEEFLKNVKSQSINPKVIEKTADDFTIVYTPLNGAGNKPVRNILEKVGFKNVYVVKEQELPDPEFTTVGYPNPEEPKVFALAIKLADEVKADIIMASDPDADRLGCVVKNTKGEYTVLTGNMIGSLIAEYIVSQKKELGVLPNNGALISTIVSTNLTEEIAKAYGIEFIQVLTGFKYIGEKIKEFEQTNSHSFLFGFEESFGYLAGTYARDKDSVGSAMLVCELAAYYKTKGLSLYEGLQEIYKKYGYFKETTDSLSFSGIQGVENIKRIMDNLREKPIEIVNGVIVTEIRDYEKGIITKIKDSSQSPTNLPKSNVLYYQLEDGTWFCVRPSGTEPKMKIYYGVKGISNEDAKEKISKVSKEVLGLVKEMEK